MFISCFHKLQTFQFENVFHDLGISDILRGVELVQGNVGFDHSVHFCGLRHVIENSNYFFLNLWMNAGFFECHSFILVDVFCHCCEASLLLLFYWFFPCWALVLTESTEPRSVLIHDSSATWGVWSFFFLLLFLNITETTPWNLSGLTSFFCSFFSLSGSFLVFRTLGDFCDFS